MTVYLPKDCRTWRYNFHFRKRRYAGSTGQSTEKLAGAWETAYRARLQREYEDEQLRRAAGLDILPAEESPRFNDWAKVYLAHVHQLAVKGRFKRPERVVDLLRVVLRFWGSRPSGTTTKTRPVDGEPYHDLRLLDPIRDPEWVVRFEQWMERRGRAGQTKNQYRSVLSRCSNSRCSPPGASARACR